MTDAVRPQSDFLKRHADLLNTTPRTDVTLFLPFRRWLDTPDCHALTVARTLAPRILPRLTSSRAVDSPIPLVAPVTTQTEPAVARPSLDWLG